MSSPDISLTKKILVSVAGMLSFLPDAVFVSLKYFVKLHRFPNLRNPKRFSEWMQWYKIKYRNPDMLTCVDKYAVRGFVEKRGYGKYLNDLYQVCETAEQIDFDSLPLQFVIKTTDGGNGDNVLVCTDKSSLDLPETIHKLNSWRHKKLESIGREWAYSGSASDSRLIVEKYLSDPHSEDGSIDDYKILCFDGKFQYLWVDKNRYSDHHRGFWNEQLEFLPQVISDHPTFEKAPTLPENVQEMISIAENLAKGFPFARIDFYNIEGKITFGEITFYPWSGYCQYTPDSFDYELGSHFSKQHLICPPKKR